MARKVDNLEVIRKGIIKATAMKDAMVASTLEAIAEDALRVAVDTHTFDNQTGNLEDSFTYGIYHDGILTKVKGVGSSLGVSNATSFLYMYGARHQQPWLLVVVAGANYGARLEGYIRKRDGILSKAGETLVVLNDSFVFVAVESLDYFKKR